METLVQHINPPQGMYPARLDGQGRLKLPKGFERYIGALPGTWFLTSIDRRTAQLYPIQTWLDNLNFLENNQEDVVAARKVAFNAADLGAETEMDSQGRIQFSPELRRELGIENQTIRMYSYRGRIEILPEAVYEERKNEAKGVTSDEVSRLESKGFK